MAWGWRGKLEMTVMQEHVKCPPKFVAAFKRVAEVGPSTLAPQFSTNFIVGRLPYNTQLCLSSFSFAFSFLIHSVTEVFFCPYICCSVCLPPKALTKSNHLPCRSDKGGLRRLKSL